MLICVVMLLSIFASCTNDEIGENDSTKNEETTQKQENSSSETGLPESDSDKNDDTTEKESDETTAENGNDDLYLPVKDPSVLPSSGDFSEIIQNADNLKRCYLIFR